MADIRQFTDARLCGHCGVLVQMEIVAQHSRGQQSGPWGLDDDGPQEGVSHRILRCPNCNGVSLEEADWQSGPEGYNYDETCKTLFPAAAAAPVGLPSDLVRIFEGSLKVRNVDADSYVTKVRKLLEAVCQRHGAKGRNLSEQIDSLAASGKIPGDLAKVAHNLRLLGNHGAHTAVDEVPQEAVPVVEKLCAALLGYLYTMPLLVTEAEDLLKKLDASRKARGKSTT